MSLFMKQMFVMMSPKSPYKTDIKNKNKKHVQPQIAKTFTVDHVILTCYKHMKILAWEG